MLLLDTSLKTFFIFILLPFGNTFQPSQNQKNSNDGESVSTLMQVNMVYRHGARSPLHSFPNDINNAKKITNWPQGDGQLTQVGMRMHYALGQFLRHRYVDELSFLSKQYARDEIYVRSTDVDRTLMSATSNLAGLFPPVGKQMWNGSTTAWQPIPVHTVAPETDTLLRFPPSNCSQYDALRSQLLSSAAFNNALESQTAFRKRIENLTGYNTSQENHVGENLWGVYDALICEKTEGLQLNSWATDSIMNRLEEIGGFYCNALFGDVYGETETLRVKIAKLTGGVILKQVIDNFHGKIYNNATYKLIQYSAHDTTVTPVLVALNFSNPYPPPFASSLIFELYKNDSAADDTSYFVSTYFKKTDIIGEKLSIYGCALDCPLDQFITLLQPVLPTGDFEERCKVQSSIISLNTLLFALVISFLLIVLALLIYGICQRCKSKKNRSDEYQYLSRDYDASWGDSEVDG